MPVFTFSTKPARPDETEAVKRVKQYCEAKGMNFSALVVKLLKEYADGLEVQSNRSSR